MSADKAARGVLVALMLTATAAFVVGVGLERHETRNEAGEDRATGESSESGASGEGRRSGESGESREGGESDESKEHKASTATTPKAAGPATQAREHPEDSEKLLGINPESTGLLVVAVVVSLVLAAGVWWLGASPLVLGVVALAMAAFAALDIREVVHQARESRTGLMLLAALVAVLHLAAAVLAARAAVIARGTQPPATSARAT